MMYTYGVCLNCGANLVYALSVDADLSESGIVIEDISISETMPEDEFVLFIADIMNKHIEIIPSDVAGALVKYAGVSPTYAERLETLILPLLITPPPNVSVKT